MGKSEQALQRRLPLVSISVLQAVISKTHLRIATCRMPLGGGSELGSGSGGTRSPGRALPGDAASMQGSQASPGCSVSVMSSLPRRAV